MEEIAEHTLVDPGKVALVLCNQGPDTVLVDGTAGAKPLVRKFERAYINLRSAR